MPRVLPLLVVVLGSLGQAQVRPRTDGGVALAPDAGLPAMAPRALAPASSPEHAPVELEGLRRDVAELRALLERHVAQSSGLTTSVDGLSGQVAALRTLVTEAEQRRISEQRQALERRQATSQAVSGLALAQQQLATGATNVGDALAAAEVAFTGPARAAVQNARLALSNGDLGMARTWLSIAAAEAARARD